MTPFDEISKEAAFLNEIKGLTGWHQVMGGENVHLRMEVDSALLDDIEAIFKKYLEMGEWV